MSTALFRLSGPPDPTALIVLGILNITPPKVAAHKETEANYQALQHAVALLTDTQIEKLSQDVFEHQAPDGQVFNLTYDDLRNSFLALREATRLPQMS